MIVLRLCTSEDHDTAFTIFSCGPVLFHSLTQLLYFNDLSVFEIQSDLLVFFLEILIFLLHYLLPDKPGPEIFNRSQLSLLFPLQAVQTSMSDMYYLQCFSLFFVYNCYFVFQVRNSFSSPLCAFLLTKFPTCLVSRHLSNCSTFCSLHCSFALPFSLCLLFVPRRILWQKTFSPSFPLWGCVGAHGHVKFNVM